MIGIKIGWIQVKPSPCTLFVLLLLFTNNILAQNLVTLALELDKRSDSILVYNSDTAYLGQLLQLELITPRDTANLKEMARFISNPWSEYNIKRFDISLVDSIWKYKNVGIPDRVRGFEVFRQNQNPFAASSESDLEEFYPGGLTDLAPVPSITTNIIEGTAGFIVDRFKKELVITFFDDFREKVVSDSLFRMLLPNTSSLLIHQDISFFLNIGETERSAFKNDLEDLLFNFERFINSNAQYRELSSDIHFRTFMLGLKTVDYSLKGYGINELLSVYYMQERTNEDALGVGIRLLRVFLVALSQGNMQDFATVFNNINRLTLQSQRTYFAAMALQKDLSLMRILQIEDQSLAPYWTEIDALIGEFLLLADNLKDQQKTLIDKSREGNLSTQTILAYAIYTFDVLDLAARFSYIRNPERYQQSLLFQKALPLARKTMNVALAVEEGDLGLVLMYSSSIIGELLALRAIPSSKSSYVFTVEERLLKYGNFMVNIINAQNSKDVQQAIEAVALPPGAARIKRQSLQSISLNTYTGGYVGAEWLSNNGNNTSVAGNLGFTSPIGLSFNWGIARKLSSPPLSYGMLSKSSQPQVYRENHTEIGTERTYLKDSVWHRLTGHSFSIFLSVIDLGAAVSYRLSNDISEGLPSDITLRQVVSPGAYIVYGIKNIPISVMGGVQYTPELRNINVSSTSLKSNTLRVSLSLTVDIPFFNLYVKQMY